MIGDPVKTKKIVDGMLPRAVEVGLTELMRVQKHVSGLVPGAISEEPTNEQIAYATFALQAELIELADELGWKKWKDNPKMTKEQRALVAEEFADVLAFVGQLLYLITQRTGLTISEIAESYRRKSQKNVARFLGTSGESGYNGVSHE